MIIAHEHIKMIRWQDVAFVTVLAFVTATLIYVAQTIFSPSIMYYISLGIFIIALNVAVYILKKSGAALFFSVLLAALTFKVDDIGVFGWKKVIVFFIAALLFEIVFLILKLRVRSVPVDMVIGSSLLLAVMPLIAAFTLSPGVIFSFPIALLNLVLLSFVIGFIASFAAFIVWHFISRTRFIIRLEADFGVL